MIGQQILARSLAPEDICAGIYVMTLHTQHQFIDSMCTPNGGTEYQVIPVVMRPETTQLPRKIVEVCLPYVVAQGYDKMTTVIDTRSERLARVTKSFAKSAIQPYRAKLKRDEATNTPCKCKKSGSKSSD